MRLYEGMFVIDAGRAAREWEETLSSVNSVLEKHGATIEKGFRFDERKLAYTIEGVRRGVYLLQYFTADPSSITDMREDLNLSESVLRYMILRLDGNVVPESPTLGTASPVPADTAIVSRDAPSKPAPAVTPAGAPKTEAPKTEAPKTEEAKTEEAKVEAPKVEAPKAEEAKAEEAKVEEAKVEEPKAEEAKVEEPKAEEPKAEEPKAEEAPVEEPKTEEPKTEEPKTEEPKTEEPKAEEAPADEKKEEA